MITQELGTLLRLYDRCIRFGSITSGEFDELVELSKEIALTQTINASELMSEMVCRMEARTNECADDDETSGE